MNSTVINEYINHFLKYNDSDSFHSLIEMGDDVLEQIELIIGNGDSKNICLCLDVLREIRTDLALKVIQNLIRHESSEVWHYAIESYTYSCGHDAEEKLKSLINTSFSQGRLDYIAEVMDDLDCSGEVRDN